MLADEVAGPLTGDQKDVVAILDHSSRHLKKLIEQLLDYNRKLADGPSEHQNVQLREIIEMVVAAYSLPERAKMIGTEIALEAEICWAEPRLLMRVLDNLYSNAVYYGEGSGNIWFRSRQVVQPVQIDIANTGIAILEAERNMIFKPFFRVATNEKGRLKEVVWG